MCTTKKLKQIFGRISKWLDETLKISDKKIELIFLGLPILTFALVELLTTNFSKDNFSIPTGIYQITLIALIALAMFIFFLIFSLDMGWLWKIILEVIFLLTYFAIIVNFYYLAPVPYGQIILDCGYDLNNDGIKFTINNKADVVSKTILWLNVSEPNLEIFLNNVPKSNMVEIVSFPKDNYKGTLTFNLKDVQNGTLSIHPSFRCTNRGECLMFMAEHSPNFCEYYCENNKCNGVQ